MSRECSAGGGAMAGLVWKECVPSSSDADDCSDDDATSDDGCSSSGRLSVAHWSLARDLVDGKGPEGSALWSESVCERLACSRAAVTQGWANQVASGKDAVRCYSEKPAYGESLSRQLFGWAIMSAASLYVFRTHEGTSLAREMERLSGSTYTDENTPAETTGTR
ncbi:hypothetical protein K466DRAFT_148388 [Polyporus arcularius HHB13444]|uniref:Uncharacterized protein n=1 Tax=Polyporus arcularius HHB13444 TaxID=1314778 RepID=A0A5C3P9Z3_9APHY|nr:hypothetical protein K466DRAFT_148388 [Polyporus arcularius HHB13444]